MNTSDKIEFVAVAAGVLLLTAILSKIIIPILKSHKLGQHILEIGPRWHKDKEGTPTMGGICFIIATLLVLLVVMIISFFSDTAKELIPLALTVGLGVLNGMIGFIDDYRKLVKKTNEGLKMHEKLFLQVFVAIIYLVVMNYTGQINTMLHIPYTDIYLELGIGYYVFAVILIAGVVNSVNLTDGIDGLASSVTLVVAGFFSVCAFTIVDRALAVVSAALIGATIGFLIYNYHPAKVFMGDTGSLFLGGMVVGAAFMMKEPLIILIAGVIYIIEAVSVILQVASFKLTGKRIFKMSPIHHHFERCDWSENKIVYVFSFITLIACVIAWFAL